MSGRILDGHVFAAQLVGKIAAEVAALRAAGLPAPGFAVLLVGGGEVDRRHVALKRRQAAAAGIGFTAHFAEAGAGVAAVAGVLERWSGDPAIDGILVQYPLPPELDEAVLQAALAPAKDIDGFLPQSIGALARGRSCHPPGTALAALMLLEQAVGRLAGRRAAVIGGGPAALPSLHLLLGADCTVVAARAGAAAMRAACRGADVVVAAVGQAELVRGDWLAPGCAVIDTGLHRMTGAGRLRLAGDVAFDQALAVAAAVTPVPGGVGPATVACLLANTLAAYRAGRGMTAERPPESY